MPQNKGFLWKALPFTESKLSHVEKCLFRRKLTRNPQVRDNTKGPSKSFPCNQLRLKYLLLKKCHMKYNSYFCTLKHTNSKRWVKYSLLDLSGKKEQKKDLSCSNWTSFFFWQLLTEGTTTSFLSVVLSYILSSTKMIFMPENDPSVFSCFRNRNFFFIGSCYK